jgi:serine/threonine-protein kinase
VSERLPPQIGRYVVDRVLGAGAMGQVYLGHDPQLDRAVAIKTIRAHGLPPEARELYMRRFQNEARAAARLHHPGIVAVYDVGEDPAAGPYLVLEFVAGSSLKQILQSRGPLDPKALVTLAEQAARALDTAHAAGIVHRDVKPDNLLLTPEGRAKLADFGIARLPDAQLTQEGQFLGTPCYAAPETLTAGEYGPRTDLFSFAATLYEAVSGARAFPGEDAVAVAHKVIHDRPPPPSVVARPGARIPRAVDEVLLRALSKDPRKRPGSAGELARELRAAFVGAGLLDPTGVHATDSHGDGAPSPAAEAGGGGGRGGLVAFAGLLLAGVAATVALLWVLRDPGVGEAADPDDAGAPRVDAAALTPRDAAEAEPTAAHDAGAPGRRRGRRRGPRRRARRGPRRRRARRRARPRRAPADRPDPAPARGPRQGRPRPRPRPPRRRRHPRRPPRPRRGPRPRPRRRRRRRRHRPGRGRRARPRRPAALTAPRGIGRAPVRDARTRECGPERAAHPSRRPSHGVMGRRGRRSRGRRGYDATRGMCGGRR